MYKWKISGSSSTRLYSLAIYSPITGKTYIDTFSSYNDAFDHVPILIQLAMELKL